MRWDARTKNVLLAFCDGLAPSQIDKLMGMVDGTAHDMVTRWWYEDKVYRNGRYEEITGKKLDIVEW